MPANASMGAGELSLSASNRAGTFETSSIGMAKVKKALNNP